MTKNQLMESVARRNSSKNEIRERINEYCRSHYGIENFYATAESHLYQFVNNEILNICLSRQIPCQNVEHLAIYKLAQHLVLQGFPVAALSMAFTRDSFISKNEYKTSLVKIPYLFRSRKGELLTQNESVLASHHRVGLDGRILDSLQTVSGARLTDFHFDLRKKVFGEERVLDFSAFFKDIAHQAVCNMGRFAPSHVFVRDGGRERKISPYEADFSNGQDPRPPADWYYFPYLLLFVDGTCALASTVDEDPRVISWFVENNKKIREICGFEPLIIDTPLKVEVEGKKYKLNEFPRWVTEREDWEGAIDLKQMDENSRIFHIVESIEQQLIQRC